MADHALVREGGLDLVRLEIFVEEFFRAVEEQASEEVLGFRTTEERDQFGDRDWRGGGERVAQGGELRPPTPPLLVRPRVPFFEIFDLLLGVFFLLAQEGG